MVRTSNFLVTINTNVRPGSASIPTAAALAATVAELQRLGRTMTTNPYFARNIVRYRGGGDESNILSVQARGRVEVGDDQQRVHQHILVTVTHDAARPGIHLIRDAILNFYRANGTQPATRAVAYCNLQGFGHLPDIEDYIRKGDDFSRYMQDRGDAFVTAQEVEATVTPDSFAPSGRG